MKTLFLALLFSSPVLYVGARMYCTPCGASAAESAIEGRYLEVRDASVFAGPCHVNGEYDLKGRRAVMAWSLAGGSYDGASLAGVKLACAVGSEENLAEGAARTSVVYVDAEDDVQRDAAVAWVEDRESAALGRVVEVKDVAFDLSFEGDAYTLAIPGVMKVAGTALADRSCCSMDENVWYEPLARVTGRVVGNSEVCRFDGADSIAAWSYEDENNTFVASFKDCGAAFDCGRDGGRAKKSCGESDTPVCVTAPPSE